MKIDKESGFADVVELGLKNWQFTVGYMAVSELESSKKVAVIYERRSDINTEKNADTAMEIAFKRMQEFMKTNEYCHVY